MSSTGGFKSSNLPPISATGMRGFLKWLQREQPNVYKNIIAPRLSAEQPAVFSDYTQSVTQNMRAAAGRASLRTRARSLSDIDDTTWELSDPNFTGGNYVPAITIPQIELPPVTDVSDAANSGAGTSTNVTSWISDILTGLSGAYKTVTQAQTAQAITNTQLQRAQMGLPPLNIGLGANGIPTIGTGLGGSSLLLIGGGLLAFVMLSRGGGRRAYR